MVRPPLFYSKRSLGKGYIEAFVKSRFPSVRIDILYQKPCLPYTHNFAVINSVIEDTFCYQFTEVCLKCGLVKVGDSIWVKDFATRAYVSKEEIIPTNLSDDFRLWWNDVGRNQPIGTWQKLNEKSPYTYYSDLLVKIFSVVNNSQLGYMSIDEISEKMGLDYRQTEDYLYSLANTGFLEWESQKISEGKNITHRPLTLNDKNEVVESSYQRVFMVKNITGTKQKTQILEIEYS